MRVTVERKDGSVVEYEGPLVLLSLTEACLAIFEEAEGYEGGRIVAAFAPGEWRSVARAEGSGVAVRYREGEQ